MPDYPKEHKGYRIDVGRRGTKGEYHGEAYRILPNGDVERFCTPRTSGKGARDRAAVLIVAMIDRKAAQAEGTPPE